MYNIITNIPKHLNIIVNT